MPKLEPKDVQKELDQGRIWPVYWLYGSEPMKSRELLRRIRTAVRGRDASAHRGFGEEWLEGGEIDAEQVVDAAQNLSLGGGVPFVVVRDAHLIKESERLAPLLGPATRPEDLSSVCVFLAKDLDGRKKFSKLLSEKAAVVACEEVVDGDREAWIGFLAKRRTIELGPEAVLQLRSLDPWTLDIVDQELEKLSLARDTGASVEDSLQLLLGSSSEPGASEAFLDGFLRRNLQHCLGRVIGFADQPDQSLPMLGLLSWNVRQLATLAADREFGGRSAKLNPYLAERLGQYARQWQLSEIQSLQSELAELDFGFKQTGRLPLGLWSHLAMQFCR